MYESYFGFNQKPFSITPNPEFLFLSRNHKEVFAHLLYGIQNHSGFIEVTGEVGTGKTTVLRTLLNQLGEQGFRLALIFNPSLSAVELLQAINREFGLPALTTSRSELHAGLNEFLLEENRRGHTVVLVIDEAQNLAAEVLEEIRLLSNLETETDKLIQIVLVGQPELADLLDQPNLRQLSQRITVRYTLQPMSEQDSRDYILHRLRIGGATDGRLLTPAALKRIYAYSRGYPRLINILCDRALLVGYARDRKQIDAAEVAVAIQELRRDPVVQDSRQIGRLGYLVLGSLLMLLLAGGAGYWWYHAQYLPTVEAAMPSAQPLHEVPVPPQEPVAALLPSVSLADLRQQLLQSPGVETSRQALTALASAWGLATDPPPGSTAVLQRLAAAKDLELGVYSADLDGLLLLGLPCVLELYLPGANEPRYLALTSISAGTVTTVPVLESSPLSLENLAGLYTGRAYYLWKNHLGIDYLQATGQQGEGVLRAQQLLRKAGVYIDEPSGVYDFATISAVTHFQAEQGLVQDGRLGPRTLAMLYRMAGDFPQPDLTGQLERQP